MHFTPEQRILWLANVRRLPFREQVAAAAQGGYGWLTTSPSDYDRARVSGLSDRDLRAIAADSGIRLTALDPMTSWVPEWQPAEMDEAVRAYIERTPDDFFRIAEALGVDSIHAVGTFPEGRYPVEYLTERYATLCDRAAEHGLRCTIEAIPHWGITKLRTVWEIVAGANRTNSGIVFDTWHYIRGGREDNLLRSLPPGAITTVQVADGTAELPPGRSLIEDCVFHRVPVGEGQMPIAEILNLLAAGGHLTSVGPEIFSAELDTLPADRILERINPSFNKVLDQIP